MQDICRQPSIGELSIVKQPLVAVNGRTVYENLKDLQVRDDRIDFLDKKGEWTLRLNLNELIRMHPNDLDIFLTRRLSCVNDCVDVVLANSKPTGFNSHGEEHIKRVIKFELDVFRQIHPNTPVSELVNSHRRELNYMITTAHLHDTKMLRGREANSEPSDDFLANIFGEDARESADFQVIARSINGHSEDVALNNGNLLEEDRNLLWIILGDKSDYHRRRILPSGVKAKKVKYDTHVRLMAFCPFGMRFTLLEGGRLGNIILPFSRMDWDQILPPSFHKDNDSLKIEVPNNWHTNKEKDALGYVQSFYGDLKRTYDGRLALLMASLFGLMPKLEVISFTIHDRETQDKQGFTVTRERDESWQNLFAFWFYMNNKNDRGGKDGIRTVLKNGGLPKFPALYGRDVLSSVHKRFRLNLPVVDEQVHSS